MTRSGNTVFIGQLVRDKLSVEVETMTDNGIEYRPVIGWFKNKRSDRRLFKIAYKYGPQSSARNRCQNEVLLLSQRTTRF